MGVKLEVHTIHGKFLLFSMLAIQYIFIKSYKLSLQIILFSLKAHGHENAMSSFVDWTFVFLSPVSTQNYILML